MAARISLPPESSRQPIMSSAIREAQYFGDARELRITFVSGRSYAYSNVSPSIYDAFLASPSKGAFFNIAVRGRFRFREIGSLAEPLQDIKRSAR